MHTKVSIRPGECHLVENILRGDPAAEAELAEHYRERIFLVAALRTKDREAASDLTQEILLAVLLALRKGQLRQQESLASFICGTARNLINNYIRSQIQRREEPLSDEPAGHAQWPDEDDAERRALVRQALNAMPRQDSLILLMTLVDNLRPGEIADRLELTSDVVRARKSRALKKIKERVRKLVTKGRTAATTHKGAR